jgi:hypothetical protein
MMLGEETTMDMETVGTMNLSNVEGFYSEDHLPIAGLLTGMIAAKFL